MRGLPRITFKPEPGAVLLFYDLDIIEPALPKLIRVILLSGGFLGQFIFRFLVWARLGCNEDFSNEVISTFTICLISLSTIMIVIIRWIFVVDIMIVTVIFQFFHVFIVPLQILISCNSIKTHLRQKFPLIFEGLQFLARRGKFSPSVQPYQVNCV